MIGIIFATIFTFIVGILIFFLDLGLSKKSPKSFISKNDEGPFKFSVIVKINFGNKNFDKKYGYYSDEMRNIIKNVDKDVCSAHGSCDLYDSILNINNKLIGRSIIKYNNFYGGSYEIQVNGKDKQDIYNNIKNKYDKDITYNLIGDLYGKFTFIKIDKVLNIDDKIYYIHDNGGIPYQVIVYNKEKNVSIYTFKNDKDPVVYDQHIKTYKNIKKIFVGKDSSNQDYDGNTILLYFGQSIYVFIGSTITYFNLPYNDKIIKYHSRIGNNDVPYPIGISKSNVYFVDEGRYVNKKLFSKNIDWENDAHLKYYNMETNLIKRFVSKDKHWRFG